MPKTLIHESRYDKFIVYYKISFAFIIKWIATFMIFLAVIGLILIIIDLTFKLEWGYPWWSIIEAVGMIIVSLAIRYGAAAALKRMRQANAHEANSG